MQSTSDRSLIDRRAAIGWLASCVTVMAGLLALCASPAVAFKTRPLLGKFGTLSEPHGIAIEQATGDVYVADTANNRVDKFSASGEFLLAFGANVGGPGVNTCTSSCAAGTKGTAPGQFTTAKFIAVDNSADASKGDVYVGDVGDNKVSKFTAAGELVATWGSGGQLDGSTTGQKTFAPLGGVAVGPSGALFVAKAQPEPIKMFEFTEAGAFKTEYLVPRLSAANGIAADAAGNLFKVNGNGSVEKLTSKAVDVGTVTANVSVPESIAIAVDPTSGDLYVATAANAIDHYEFNGSGQVIEPGGPPCTVAPTAGCSPTDSTSIPFSGSGIAVDGSSGDVYLSNPSAGEVFRYGPLVTVPDVTTEAPTQVNSSSATLNGKVNPDELAVTACEFEYVGDPELRELLGEDYEELVEHGVAPEAIFEALGSHAACESPNAAEIGSGKSDVAVHAHVSGLTAGGRYHFRLVAANANGSHAGSVLSFVTVTPPRFDVAAAANLTPSSVDLTASINPGSGETTYRFEYGTSTAYGTSIPVPDQDIGAGASDVAVSQHVTGLSPNVTYHWRIVASNSAGTTIGADHTFIFKVPGGTLPDGRAYEMVTPPKKNGALIGESAGIGLQPSVSSSGDRVIATVLQCFEGAQSCNSQHAVGVGAPYSFTRSSSGWSAAALAPAATTQQSANTPWGYLADSGVSLFSMPTPPAGQDDLYKHEAGGGYLDIGPVSPPELGPLNANAGKPGAFVQAQTADLSHFAWNTGSGPLHWPFDATEGHNESAYEYAGLGNTQPLLVGVSGGQGSTELIGRCGTALGSTVSYAPPGVMSSDGRIVYFTTRTPSAGVSCPGGSGANAGKPVPADSLYARVDGERADAHTAALSQRSLLDCTTPSCQSSPPGDALFTGASEDGSIAYFLDTQQLTDAASEDSHAGDSAYAPGCAATTGPNGCNLYLYDFANPAGHQLVAVSAGDTSGEGPRVQGVAAISADGSHVYFVAKGVLAANHDAVGAAAQSGSNNLYVYERDAAHPSGRTTFIAALPSSDNGQWLEEGVRERSNVSPDGRFLVFVSSGDLTPDDSSVSGAQQVFRFDASSGALTRISIGDEGFNDNGNRSSATPCAVSGATVLCSENASIAQPSFIGGLNGRRDPTMSDDGSYVFFLSPLALAPGALDDVTIGSGEGGTPVYAQNVYEWHAGRVYLISDGRDVSANAGSAQSCALTQTGTPSSVCLLGADAAGANVFFTTTDRLVGQDTDTELDYYDARICTSGDPCLNQSPAGVAECDGEACQGAPSAPPAPPAAGGALLSGAGNAPAPASSPTTPPKPKPLTRAQKLAKALKACRTKHDKHKRAACEKQARKRYGPPAKKAKKSAKSKQRGRR